MIRTKIFEPRMPGRRTENETRPVGRIWPNGEFSVGYVPVLEEADLGGYAYAADRCPFPPPEDEEEYYDQLEFWDEGEDCSDSMHGLPCSVPLTLSNASDSHKSPPRAKYGLKGLTARAEK